MDEVTGQLYPEKLEVLEDAFNRAVQKLVNCEFFTGKSV
jgi:hypothetical protein